MSADDVRARLRQAGVQKGIDEKKLLPLLDKVARGEGLHGDQQIAEGRPPQAGHAEEDRFQRPRGHGPSGNLTIRKDGGANFRAQDRITRIKKGELVATVRPRNPLAEDGWDVTGRQITPPQPRPRRR